MYYSLIGRFVNTQAAEPPPEVSQTIYASIGAILHTTLGSDSEVTSPVIDYEGSSLAVTNTPSYETGKFNNAATGGGTNGSSNTIYVAANKIPRTTFTIEFWCKRTGSAEYMAPVNMGGATDSCWFWIERRGTQGVRSYSIRMGFKQGSATSIELYKAYGSLAGIDAIFPSDTWVHCAFSKDDSDGTVRLWVDGEEQTGLVFYAGSASDLTGNSGTYAQTMYVSTGSSGIATGMDGPVDNLRIYNYLKVNFNDRELETNKDIIFHSRLGADGEITSPEVNIGSSTPTIEGTASYVTGRFGQAIDIPANNSNYPKVTQDGYEFPYDPVTVEFWWTPELGYNDTSNVTCFLFTVGQSGGTSTAFFLWKNQYSGDTRWYFRTKTSSATRAQYYFDNTTSYNAGDKIHVAVTYDGSAASSNRAKVYINGVSQAINSVVSDGVHNFAGITNILHIGKQDVNPTTTGPRGEMDNFRIYNAVKTDFWDRHHEYEPKLLAHLKMEDAASITTPYINELDTPVLTGFPTYTAGKYGNAYVGTSGADVKVDNVSAWLNPKNHAGAFEFWWKPTDLSTGNIIINTRDPGSATCVIIDIVSSGGNVTFKFIEGNGGVSYLNFNHSHSNYSVGTYYHLAMCWDFDGIEGTSDTVRVYRNGTLLTSSTTGGGSPTDYTADNWLILGNHTSNNAYLRGEIDNFKMFNFAKTDFTDRDAE